MVDKPVVIITGASSGIGEATARIFAQEGYRIVLAARRLERLQALANEIQEKGGEALPVPTDISCFEDIQNLVRTTLEGFSRVDILVNNAGFGRLNWLEQLDASKDIQAQIQVNLLGLIWLTWAVIPFMISRRQGHIINIASVAGLIAPPTYSIYSATKFAVLGFSEALRREVGVYSIRVSTICPGSVETEFGQHAHIQRKTNINTPAYLVLSADQVARAILRVSRHPRRLMIIPWYMRLAVWLNWLAPGFIDVMMERLFVLPERTQ